jgi:hypothetical protein
MAATSMRPPSGVNLIAFDNQHDLADLAFIRLNLTQPVIDICVKGD